MAVPDLVDATREADILVFVIPHQFIGRVCDTIKGKIKSDALGMSLIKVRTAYCVMIICVMIPCSEATAIVCP